MPGDEQYKTIWANDLVSTDSHIGALSAWGKLLLWWYMLRLKHNIPLAEILQPINQFIPSRLQNTMLVKFMKQRTYDLGFKQRPERPVLPLKATKSTISELSD